MTIDENMSSRGWASNRKDHLLERGSFKLICALYIYSAVKGVIL